MANFNANELGKTISVLEKLIEEKGYIESGAMLIGHNGLSFLIRSDDSNLADTCGKVSATVLEVSIKATSVIREIEEALKKYAQATLENEAGTTQTLDGINSSLESIKAQLTGIAIS